MGTPLRVLIVEDSVDDTELVLRLLRRAGYDPVSERVQTAEEMKTALEREAWDLVVSDYTMPQFAAPSALNLLNQSGRDVPFIVVSGSIGEDIAVAMMKTGAHDYILKHNLTRFIPAVQRELREAENRRHQRLTEQAKQRLQLERDGFLEQLKQENEDLTALTRVTANAISTLDLDELLRVLLERIVEVMRADAATILLADGAELRVRASVGTVTFSDTIGVVLIGEGFAGSVATRKKPMYVEDAAVDPLVTDSLIRERGIRSMLGVPLKRNGTLIGVLHVDWLTVRPCRDREVHLLEITAERCSAAIQNAQLYQEAKRVAAALTESEAHLHRLSSAIEQTADSVLITDRTGVIEYVNPAFRRTTGYSSEEVIGKTPRLLKSGKHDQKLYETMWKTILGGETFLAEFVNRKKSGELYHTEHSINAIRDTQGHITHFVSTGRDVTERKLAEAALRENDQRLQVALSGINIAVFHQDLALRYTWVYQPQLGYTPDQVAGHTDAELLPPEAALRVTEIKQRVLETGARVRGVVSVVADGTTHIFDLVAEPLRDTSGEIIGLTGATLDITERARAEDALKLFRALLDQSNDSIEVVDPETGRFLDINEKGHLVLGYSREECLALSVFDVDPTVDQSIFPTVMEELRRTGAMMWKGSHRRKDGSTFPVEVNVRYVQLERDYVLAVVRDITERQRAEVALQESERIRRLVLDNVDEFAYMIELGMDGMLTGKVCFVSGRVEQILGYQPEEFIRDPGLWFGIIHPDDAPALASRTHVICVSGQPGIREYRVRHKGTGEYHWMEDHVVPQVDAAGRVVSQFGVARDITERKQLEGQLLRTQRLESIGTLAGGVAHDLNNALAPIMMATELLRLEFPESGTQYLSIIQDGARRGADMVKQLLTFAKGAEGERRLLQPTHLLREIEKLIKGTFPKNIELKVNYAKDLWTILGDATQLHQVLLNLCLNARDAMPNGGTLTLKEENVEVDTVCADTVSGAKRGHYVLWSVTDTGMGIPREIIERVFEPFFSTKRPDKGTGLGLSTVMGIVKSHGGSVRVYSIPGQGSNFAVYLPASGSEVGGGTLLAKTETTFRGNGETILVVDDEAAVREIMRAVLTALNFKVITTSGGTEALVQVTENRATLRAVITDLHMPGMDGLAFVRVVKGRLPQAGIIVASGRMDEREEREFEALGVNVLLDKPFSQEKLVAALKTVFQE